VPKEHSIFMRRRLGAFTMEKHHSKAVTEIDSASVDIVITLCEKEVCPAFLGQAKRYHWNLNDSDSQGLILEDDAILRRFERARELIQDRLVLEKDTLLGT